MFRNKQCLPQSLQNKWTTEFFLRGDGTYGTGVSEWEMCVLNYELHLHYMLNMSKLAEGQPIVILCRQLFCPGKVANSSFKDFYWEGINTAIWNHQCSTSGLSLETIIFPYLGACLGQSYQDRRRLKFAKLNTWQRQKFYWKV